MYFASCLLLLSILAARATLLSEAAGVLRNVTVGVADPSVTFSAGWSVALYAGQEIAFADGLGDEVAAELPVGAVAVHYVGLKRSGGALYAACLDCDVSGDVQFEEVDATDRNGDDSTPVILFSFTELDNTVAHELQVVNLEDPAFGDTSQITFQSLIITVQEDDNNTSTASSSTTSDSSTTITSASISTTSSVVLTTVQSSSLSTVSTTLSTAATVTSTSSDALTSTTSASTASQAAMTVSSTTSLQSTSSASSSSVSSITESVSSTETGSATTNTASTSATASSTSSSDTSTTSSSISSTTSTSSTSTSSSNSSSLTTTAALSTRTIVAVAVGSGIGILILLSILVLFLVRARRQQSQSDTESNRGLRLIREISAPSLLSSSNVPIRPRSSYIVPDRDAPARPKNPYKGRVRSNVPIDQPSHPVTPPPMPTRSPLRSEYPSSVWLERIPRTPTAGSDISLPYAR
ncbi:uncharacterized protein LAESUDRAFT_137769 [Laetiporus sulphureus 93-53]|uniref:Mid2 domain-containing protein n=1 Tax=Laetiporus sulphureus 93-53 TaxID=1314785 RepID=A0A165EDJ6_9APHY|nr:uncharacterized protein LAESUDRAFT_137769 [Laetiporus sulphureus 93-53]KZT06806.1 hypothetical protein LAESUDRAFT_137769 [Laetiporus sulphureus 93-53]